MSPSADIWPRELPYKFIDISEDQAASIFRAEAWEKGEEGGNTFLQNVGNFYHDTLGHTSEQDSH